MGGQGEVGETEGRAVLAMDLGGGGGGDEEGKAIAIAGVHGEGEGSEERHGFMVGGAAAEAEGLSQEDAAGGAGGDVEAAIGREEVGVAQERQELLLLRLGQGLLEVWELEDGGARAMAGAESASEREMMEGRIAGGDGDGDGDGEEE